MIKATLQNWIVSAGRVSSSWKGEWNFIPINLRTVYCELMPREPCLFPSASICSKQFLQMGPLEWFMTAIWRWTSFGMWRQFGRFEKSWIVFNLNTRAFCGHSLELFLKFIDSEKLLKWPFIRYFPNFGYQCFIGAYNLTRVNSEVQQQYFFFIQVSFELIFKWIYGKWLHSLEIS